MKTKLFILISATAILLMSFSSCSSDINRGTTDNNRAILKKVEGDQSNWIPTEGYIRNKEVAIMVGSSILQSSYGFEKIQKQKPLDATLSENVWIVRGRLPEGMLGGVAEIQLDKFSGRVLKMSHGK